MGLAVCGRHSPSRDGVRSSECDVCYMQKRLSDLETKVKAMSKELMEKAETPNVGKRSAQLLGGQKLVVTPGQVRANRPDIDGWVEKINRALMNRDIWPMTYTMNGMSRREVETILERYGEAGWKVSPVYDQRDGNHLKFEEP